MYIQFTRTIQKFLLKLSHNVNNRCETLMIFSAIKSVFKIILLYV